MWPSFSGSRKDKASGCSEFPSVLCYCSLGDREGIWTEFLLQLSPNILMGDPAQPRVILEKKAHKTSTPVLVVFGHKYTLAMSCAGDSC